jgi:hypothetical protein
MVSNLDDLVDMMEWGLYFSGNRFFEVYEPFIFFLFHLDVLFKFSIFVCLDQVEHPRPSVTWWIVSSTRVST